jgi:hypothetical protein
MSMITGLLATVVAWAALLGIGESTARVVFGPRRSLLRAATRLPLGLAAATCILETAGFFLPIRIAAWLLVFPAAHGAKLMFSPSGRENARRDFAVHVTSLLALGVGLLPVFVAGRFTAAALTNNDGTYYLTVAERLRALPWRVDHDPIPFDQCLNDLILHFWNWRLGTPNLMAAVSTLSTLGAQPALAVVTAVLFACVPPAVIGIARSASAPSHLAELAVGSLAALSAAPAFVGYQHMTGHLAACALFPAATVAVFSAVRRGGVRRVAYGALLLGAGVAFFADGASVLVVGVAACVLSNAGRPVRALRRGMAVGLASLVAAPFSVARAFLAARQTLLGVHEVSVTGRRAADALFPQRGWLPRSVLDDLTTAAGVDPWPPWPAPSPPTPQAWITWGATLAFLSLVALGTRRLRRRERVLAALVGLALATTLASLGVWYLRGKVLLTASAFAAPVAAIGLATVRARWARLAYALVVAGELVAMSGFARSSRWKVVDQPSHDALVPELARLPVDSYLAFDGLGAPADTVLDTQRAYRAALLARLHPLQPGLDGGFYAPLRCPTAARPDPPPAHAYALQRRTSETVSGGKKLAEWGDFRVIEADLNADGGFVAAWAPTHGWLRAEHEADGTVFRWGESESKGTLQVLSRLPCARLGGELRVVSGSASLAVDVNGELAHAGYVTPEWTSFETRPFAIAAPVTIVFRSMHTGPGEDEAHALAVRNLSVTPAMQCDVRAEGVVPEGLPSLPITLTGPFELRVASPGGAPCGEAELEISGEPGLTVRVAVDGTPPTAHYLALQKNVLTAALPAGAAPHTLRVELLGAPGRSALLTDVRVSARACR